jgi:hypothetical protein
VAKAGTDQQAGEDTLVRLKGEGSDPDGTIAQNRWEQIGGPVVTLSGSTGASPSFVSPRVAASTHLDFRFTVTDNRGGSASDEVRITVDPSLTLCIPTAPPSSLGLDPFYKKYCDAAGLPVVSSGKVPDAAVQHAWSQVRQMVSARPDVRAEMLRLRTRVAIMAVTEVTTDIPEHSDLNTAFPGTDWDTRARGLGATPSRPASSAAEENILCSAQDPYRGENILIHEFAHSMDLMGLRQVDSTFQSRLQQAYNTAIAAGLWSNTYAATNKEEYWAEGVQSWFNVNLEADPPNGIHNSVNTRAELKVYDPGLHQLISEVMPADWLPSCPTAP